MFTIDPEGLEEAQALLKTVSKMGSAIRAVELNAKDRKEGGSDNNAKILEYLADGGRDFVTLSDTDQKEMESILVKWLEKGLDGKGKSKQNTSALANQIAAKAFMEAAKFWNEKISEHIKDGKWQGGGDSKLNPEYEEQKQKKHGFAYPIGVATGQVSDNVAPGSRNIKLRK